MAVMNHSPGLKSPTISNYLWSQEFGKTILRLNEDEMQEVRDHANAIPSGNYGDGSDSGTLAQKQGRIQTAIVVRQQWELLQDNDPISSQRPEPSCSDSRVKNTSNLHPSWWNPISPKHAPFLKQPHLRNPTPGTRYAYPVGFSRTESAVQIKIQRTILANRYLQSLACSAVGNHGRLSVVEADSTVPIGEFSVPWTIFPWYLTSFIKRSAPVVILWLPSLALTAAPFIALGLILVTLPHHWRVKNLATMAIIIWLSVYNLTYGVNALIWAGNVNITVPIWCDIATKLKIGADAGLPGTSLCMARRLNRIAHGFEMAPRGWRHLGLDIMLCFGFPVIVMALHYIVQGHRFDILEDLGCIPAIYISWPSILILDLSAFIPAVLALVYCIVAILRLYRRRLAFSMALDKSDSMLTLPRYVRLMIMTFFLGTWNTVLISLSTVNEYLGEGLLPWASWDAVHANFSFIGQYTDSDFSPQTIMCAYLLWWAVPLSGLTFFVFFGIGDEAMKDYRASAAWVGRVVFRRHSPPPTTDGPSKGDLYRIPSIRSVTPIIWAI
ncbi:pheromone A receptor-domain-containing protein [Mycena maculata]|uniref:Pheromone A receptor-domain-containing protein n=1 Tax=Mycena maculata TaxID=230809 RepID=A0AAD7JEF0_9AGAR|nr:pheromone A receptor-domain-containing protein [Mycena maculata]